MYKLVVVSVIQHPAQLAKQFSTNFFSDVLGTRGWMRRSHYFQNKVEHEGDETEGSLDQGMIFIHFQCIAYTYLRLVAKTSGVDKVFDHSG